LHQSFIIHAFLDDLWDFIQSLPFGISFSGDRKSPVFVFCCFKDLLDLKLIGDFYSLNILSREASGEVVAHKRSYEAQMGKGGAAHQAGRATRARLALEHHLISIFFYVRLRFDRKEMPYFSHNFFRQRRNPSSTSERADLLLPPEGNCHRHYHRLLLGLGEILHHLPITIFIIPNISTISTSIFGVISLIVCGRSNPG
jgi:hypothetical protein